MGDFDRCINEFETEGNSNQMRCLPLCSLRKDTTRIKFMALVVVSKSSTTIESRMETSEPIRVTKLDNEVSQKIEDGTMSPTLRRRKREDVTIQDENSTNVENDDPEPSVSVSPNDATVKDEDIAENVTHEDNNGDTDDGRKTTWDREIHNNTHEDNYNDTDDGRKTTWGGEMHNNTHEDKYNDTDDGRKTTWYGEIHNNTHEDNYNDTDDGRKTTWDGDIPKNTKITEPAMQIDLVAYLEWPDNNFSRFWCKSIAITYMKVPNINMIFIAIY